MLYPQISGEPNFILIGVSAVFGLLVIIIVYYIVVSKSSRPGRLYSGSAISMLQPNAQNAAGITKTSGIAPINSNTVAGADGMPVPINTGGYYAPVATGSAAVLTPSVTLSNPNIKQVFNIKENIYALEDAAGVCGALGADVSTLDQLVDAHKQGADWCNVGWTKDGLAAFPIQYSTWQTLQGNNPANRNMCGQPGINLVRNDPNLLYGVNCYGVKPEPKNGEKVKQVMQNDSQIALNAKIAQFQQNLNAIGVASFNQNAWSE
jgi:hypothetical protein